MRFLSHRTSGLQASRTVLLVCLLAMPAAACTDAGTAGEGETIELSLGTYMSPDNPNSVANEAWMERVEEETNGRVSFDTYYGGSLCSVDELMPCARDGRLDIAFTSTAFHPSDFPLGNVVSVPFLTSDMNAQLRAYRELYEEHEEFRGEQDRQNIRVLHFQSIAPSVLGTQQPTESIDDLEGEDIRAIAYMVNALNAIGSNPVAIDSPEIYESVQQGVMGGWFAFPMDAAVLDSSLEEVTDYWSYPGLGTYVSVYTVINQDTWDSLPDDIQRVMIDASADLEDTFVSEFQEPADKVACDQLIEAGVNFTVWEDAEMQRWKDAVGDSAMEDWLEESRNLGAEDPEGFLGEYRTLLERYEQDSNHLPAPLVCQERIEEAG